MTSDTDARLRRRLDAGITGWRGVSRQYVWVELAGIAVGAVIGLAVGVGALLVNRWIGGVLLAVVLIVAVVRLVLTPRRVRAIGYALREDDLVFRRGILYSR